MHGFTTDVKGDYRQDAEELLTTGLPEMVVASILIARSLDAAASQLAEISSQLRGASENIRGLEGIAIALGGEKLRSDVASELREIAEVLRDRP